MLPRRGSAGWLRLRALVLAAVVFIGGFGLPAFDAIAYHWHAPANTSLAGTPRLQPYGTPLEHAVQCVLTHNAPAPRLIALSGDHLPVTSIVRSGSVVLTPDVPSSADHYNPNPSRAPPVSPA